MHCCSQKLQQRQLLGNIRVRGWKKTSNLQTVATRSPHTGKEPETRPLLVLFEQCQTSPGTLPEFVQGQQSWQQWTELAIQCWVKEICTVIKKPEDEETYPSPTLARTHTLLPFFFRRENESDAFLLQFQQPSLQHCCLPHPSHPHPSIRDMALPVIGFLLALSSFCASTTPDCKDVVKPFMPDDPKLVSDFLSICTVIFSKSQKTLFMKVFGKWVYVMGAGDPKPYHKALESMKSSWIHLAPTSDTHIVTLRWGDRCL